MQMRRSDVDECGGAGAAWARVGVVLTAVVLTGIALLLVALMVRGLGGR
jgi:hypothetical protein